MMDGTLIRLEESDNGSDEGNQSWRQHGGQPARENVVRGASRKRPRGRDYTRENTDYSESVVEAPPLTLQQ